MTPTDDPRTARTDAALLDGVLAPDGAVTEPARGIAERFELGRVREVVALPGAGRRNAAILTDDGSWILRVGADVDTLRKERFFADAIRTTTRLATPWPFDIDDAGDLLRYPYAVMPRLPGQTLWWAHEHDWAAVGEALADAALELHRTAWPAAGEWDPAADAIAADHRPAGVRCAARADELKQQLDASGHSLDDQSSRWVDTLVAPARQSDEAGVACLVHGDFVIGNVGLTPAGRGWRVTGVFDLEAARVGEPEDDFIGHVWWACYGGRPEAAVAFLQRYRPDGAFSPRLRTYLVLRLLANWEFGQRNHEPWYGHARTFSEWAGPIVDAVDRVLAAAYG